MEPIGKGKFMKKTVGYIIISVIAIMLFIGLGYITYSAMGKPIPAVCFPGGEYEAYYGMGFTVEKWYPLKAVGEENCRITKQFSFNIVTFITGVLLFTAIQWISIALINKRKQGNSIV